jgi:hypothetical protein
MIRSLCMGGAAVVSWAVATVASAGVVSFSSDAAFVSYQSSGGFTKTFGGNVRWGNGSASGDWEYAIVDGSDIPIGAVANTAWSGVNTHAVTFTYSAGSATLSLSGIGTLTRSVATGPTSLFARVRDSESPFSSLTNIRVDLASNGVGVDYVFASLAGDPDAAYWGIEDANLSAGFTITADAELAGPRSSGSDPMYQFKIGVPTPGALTAFGLAGLAMARRRR